MLQIIEMLATMDVSMKANKELLEKADANIKNMQEKMDASHRDAKAMRNDTKTNQAELKSAIEEKMKDAMQSMRSELDETIRHRLEKAMTNVSRETQKLQTELVGRIEKIQV
jgi:F0F1-type ATP synthase membrane subunit b/b'